MMFSYLVVISHFGVPVLSLFHIVDVRHFSDVVSCELLVKFIITDLGSSF